MHRCDLNQPCVKYCESKEKDKCAISKKDIEIKELKKEINRLRKQLANNHHIECNCSFCKGIIWKFY